MPIYLPVVWRIISGVLNVSKSLSPAKVCLSADCKFGNCGWNHHLCIIIDFNTLQVWPQAPHVIMMWGLWTGDEWMDELLYRLQCHYLWNDFVVPVLNEISMVQLPALTPYTVEITLGTFRCWSQRVSTYYRCHPFGDITLYVHPSLSERLVILNIRVFPWENTSYTCWQWGRRWLWVHGSGHWWI